jgi:hypothetical protein
LKWAVAPPETGLTNFLPATSCQEEKFEDGLLHPGLLLKIKHQYFTVVLHLKRVRDPGAHAVGSEVTVTLMEI